MRDATVTRAVEGAGSGAILKRVISAGVALPPVLAAIYFGSPWFAGLVLLGSALLVWEWARLCGAASSPLSMAVAQAAVLGAIVATAAEHTELGLLSLALGVVGAVIVGRARTVWLAAGILYVGIPTVLLVWIRDDLGVVTAFWLFALVWATDTGAYAFGRMIGGVKLAPRISPNKTWAGLVGGMVCAAAVGAAIAWGRGRDDALWVLATVSALLAVAAQAGDLFESWVKRHFEVKDSGGIMPGHGGLLDRVDGLLTAAVVVAAIGYFDGHEGLVWL